MERAKLQNRLISAAAFPTFHITTIWLPISISYPHWILSWVTLGHVQMHPLSNWGWFIRAVILILNFSSFLLIFRLLTVKQHRTLLFLINCYGVYPTMVISSFFGAIWNIAYMIIMGRSLRKRHAEFVTRRDCTRT